MSDNLKARYGLSLPVGFILFCIFMVLKLQGTITWSWLWVSSPLWIPFAMMVPVVVLVVALTIKADSRNRAARARIRVVK